MLKFLGLIAVMGASLTVGICYRGYREELLKHMEALCEFLVRLLREVESYGRSVGAWIKEYSSPILAECGFLERVRGGEQLYSAFLASMGEIHIPKQAEELVKEVLERYGKRNIETEITELRRGVDRLEEIIKTEKEAKDKSVRAVFAMSMGVAVGLCLLLS